MAELGVGIVGCGYISGIYLENMPSFAGIKAVACTDIIPERSAAKAAAHGIADVTPDEIMKRDDVDIILNITPPLVHYEVSQAALSAGKHVFGEKPLCVELEHGRALVAEADRRGLKIGCAPDTFLGAGGRLAREMIDAGVVGKVVAGSCYLMSHGMEHWHPDPVAFYQHGGGPLLDIGPYYLNALINLLGPVESVRGLTSSATSTRFVTAEGPRKNQHIPVETPTTIMGLMHFANGADIIFSCRGTSGSTATRDRTVRDGGNVARTGPEFLRRDRAVHRARRNLDYRERQRTPIWPAELAVARLEGRSPGRGELPLPWDRRACACGNDRHGPSRFGSARQPRPRNHACRAQERRGRRNSEAGLDGVPPACSGRG